MADHGNHYERLRGDEELRFVSAEGAEAEQRADERELRKTHRAGGGREHGADAAELVEEGLDYAPQSTRSRSRRSVRAVAAADEVTIA